MNVFIVRMRHDKGYVNVKVLASSEESARVMACNAEHAPESAIVSVTKKRATKMRM